MTRIDRKRYIGGHDIAALMGMHPHSTPGHVYRKLVHQYSEDIGDKPSVRRGRILEKALLDEIEERDGVELKRDVFLLDDEMPFVGGTVDAFCAETKTLYEVTTTLSKYGRDKWGPDGTEDAATHKWIQAQFYSGLKNEKMPTIERVEVICWIVDTDEILRYPSSPKKGAIAEMRSRAEAFYYDHVLPQQPPTVDWGRSDPAYAAKMLEAIYSKEDGNAIEPTPELVRAAFDYVEAREEEKAATNK